MEQDDPIGEDVAAGPARPGALSLLLLELAAAPEEPEGADWVAALAPGMTVGRFKLLQRIGRGGFGVVFEAEDTVLRRRVALKAVRTGARSDLRKERLLQEADAAARLSHPNIVTLFDLGRCEQGPYLVLELLRGQSLAGRLATGPAPLPVEEVVRIGVEVARGLAYAHGRGVVHRDLAPGNVFLCEDGAVKLLDFGMAHAFGHTRADGGTPDFMAPEQWRGAPEDERTDVFALGVNLFKMLTGILPLAAQAGGGAPAASAQAPALEVAGAPALGPLIGRMLEQDPTRRPRDGAEALAALLAIQEKLPAPGGAPGAPVRVRRRGAGPAARLALGLAVAAALAVAGWWWGALRPPPPGGRMVVAVADVLNETGERDLDGLSGMLIASLEQSKRLSVLTRARMQELARQAGQPQPGPIDEVLGKEICRRALARALVTAVVRRLGAVYTLEVRALDPEQDAYLFALSERAGTKEEVLGAIDRISSAARRALHEPAPEVDGAQAGVATLVTGNLNAYGHYVRARDLLARVRFAEAVDELRLALALEPDFALAHFALARLGRVGELSEAERARHAREALRLQDRLPSRERGLLLASEALRAGKTTEAEAGLRSLAEEHLDDKDVAVQLGGLLLEQERPEEAVTFLERAAALDPTDVDVVSTLQDALGWLGQTDRLLTLARQGRQAAPGPQTTVMEAAALLWAGRSGEAAALAADGLAQGEPQGEVVRLAALLHARDFAALDGEIARLRSAPEAGKRRRAVRVAVLVHALRGRRTLALAELAQVDRGTEPRYPAYESRGRLAVLVALAAPEQARAEAARLVLLDPAMAGTMAASLAWAGDLTTAALLAKGLAPATSEGALYRAAVDWRAGRRDEALTVLRRLARTHASGSFLDVLFLGEACLEAGDAEEAARALRRFRGLQPPARFEPWSAPRAALLLARAELALGHREAARALAEEWASVWREADADYLPARELRALLDRLGP